MNITLFLAVWGAVLSTALFFFTFSKYRKEIKGKLKIKYHFSGDLSALEIKMWNTSFRVVTILSYEILYAASDYYYQVVTDFPLKEPATLKDSEVFKTNISRQELINAAAKHIRQNHYHALRLRVYTTNSGYFTYAIRVPDSIIGQEFPELAGPYIATDIFLGFPVMESTYHPTGKNIIGAHK